jgi:uroporphyrin-3 C-methyltransferase
VSDSPIDLPPAAGADAPAPGAASRAPARPSLWPWLLLLLALTAGALWFWNAQTHLAQAERSRNEWQQVAEELRGRQLEVDRELEALRDRQRLIDTRLTDNASVQRVLREELLGVGERAALLEDALTRLAQTRQEGAQAMLLDEAEFLLLTGEERLMLFADPAAAIRALTLADAALAGLQEPIYAPLRQTLAQEIERLQALPSDPLPLARARVAALLADLPRLPPPPSELASSSADPSPVLALLGKLVTVRRLDESGAPLDPLLRGARLAGLGLRLQLGLTALERGDWAAWEQARSQASEEFPILFDTADPKAAAHRDALAAVPAAAPTPSIGNTLRELRGLRTTRRLSELAPVPQAAAPRSDSGMPPSPETAASTKPAAAPAPLEPSAAEVEVTVEVEREPEAEPESEPEADSE